MKKYFFILAVLFFCLGMAGCKNEDLSEDTYIELKDLDVETVRNLVQGKWEVTSLSVSYDGVTDAITRKPEDMNIEFIGNTIWRITDQSSITDYTITGWEKTENPTVGEGICLTIEENFPILLENLHNDTLHYRQTIYQRGFIWRVIYRYGAVRIK